MMYYQEPSTGTSTGTAVGTTATDEHIGTISASSNDWAQATGTQQFYCVNTEEIDKWYEAKNRAYYNRLLLALSKQSKKPVKQRSSKPLFHRKSFMKLRTFRNLRF